MTLGFGLERRSSSRLWRALDALENVDRVLVGLEEIASTRGLEDKRGCALGAVRGN